MQLRFCIRKDCAVLLLLNKDLQDIISGVLLIHPAVFAKLTKCHVIGIQPKTLPRLR